MEYAMFILFVFVIIPGIIAINIVKRVNHYYDRSYSGSARIRGRIVASYPERVREILKLHFSYFNILPVDKQKRFVSRVLDFLGAHYFDGGEGLDVTDEMAIRVAAVYVRMTYRMRSCGLDWFNQIIIYPATYYSPFSKTYNRGEANSNGILVFSWRHFEEGMENESDGLNLAYHEFAHAIIIQYTRDGFGGWTFDQSFQKLGLMIRENRVDRAASRSGIYRDYAFSNKMEFFAVTAELFFETPFDLKRALPEMYQLFCDMFHQDPLKSELSEIRYEA